MLNNSIYAAWIVFATLLPQSGFASPQTDAAVHWPRQCDGADVSEKDRKAERLPALAADNLDVPQKQAVNSISSGARGCIFGPFSIILRSPELLNRTQQMGEYLRFQSVLPKELRELAILVVGRAYDSPYVWYIHEPIALESGVRPDIVDAIAADRRPAGMSEDEAVVYDFSKQLAITHFVSDDVFNRISNEFGQKSTIELTGLTGYFATLADHLNVARTPLPKGVDIPFGKNSTGKE
jgi:4-carboxymuconolactone decarboxylase